MSLYTKHKSKGNVTFKRGGGTIFQKSSLGPDINFNPQPRPRPQALVSGKKNLPETSACDPGLGASEFFFTM